MVLILKHFKIICNISEYFYFLYLKLCLQLQGTTLFIKGVGFTSVDITVLKIDFEAIIFSCAKVKTFLIEYLITNALYCMLINQLMCQIYKLKFLIV